jgi:hypothetical protein
MALSRRTFLHTTGAGGSQWAVADPQRQNIFDAVTRSFAIHL